VATANESNADLASQAIELRLPVVVDKPLATTTVAAKDLVERAAEAGVPLTVFHNRRWDSDFLTAKRLAADGSLGRVHRLESRFERWRPEAPSEGWRFTIDRASGGGVLLDLGTHLIDQAIQLFGPVAEVHGEVRHIRGGPADDDAFVALRHEGGQSSHIWVSQVAPAVGPRMRLIGDAGAFVTEELDGQEDALKEGRRPGPSVDWGREPPERWGRIIRGDESEPVEPDAGDWPSFYRRAALALREGGEMPVDPRDAVEVLRLMEQVA